MAVAAVPSTSRWRPCDARASRGVPRYGWGSVTVPGAIDAFVEVQRRHGKLTFAEVLEPAIYYASEGFPVS